MHHLSTCVVVFTFLAPSWRSVHAIQGYVHTDRFLSSRPRRKLNHNRDLFVNRKLTTRPSVFNAGGGVSWSGSFDELPDQGVIQAGRLPYAGYIYPDGAGGTMNAMRKYDQAFNRGRSSAASFEQRDIDVHKEAQRYGFFRRRVRYQTPHWHGHCNGWTAAAIRHAEPQNNVTRNGVTFNPADIKGMLAEVYMYTTRSFWVVSTRPSTPALFTWCWRTGWGEENTRSEWMRRWAKKCGISPSIRTPSGRTERST